MDDLQGKIQQLIISNQPHCLYKSNVYRLVETQEFAATTNLVDDLHEQSVLEDLLEQVKPKYREGTEDMHYLLKTPFRYPPLKYGSRFGNRQLASFFYASEDIHTALAEVAHYRLLFMADMEIVYEQAIVSQHVSFSVEVASHNTIDFCQSIFDEFLPQLMDKNNYHFCQSLGKWLVEDQQTEVIRYHSVRRETGKNLAVYLPKAIVSTQPQNQQQWLCQSRYDSVSFSQPGLTQPLTFNKVES